MRLALPPRGAGTTSRGDRLVKNAVISSAMKPKPNHVSTVVGGECCQQFSTPLVGQAARPWIGVRAIAPDQPSSGPGNLTRLSNDGKIVKELEWCVWP